MGIRNEKAIREALSIPENELLGAVIAVGYRAINPDKPKRKTVDDILTGLKIFLSASAECRAQRRWRQLQEKGIHPQKNLITRALGTARRVKADT